MDKIQNKAIFHLFIPSLFQHLDSWSKGFAFEVEAPYLSSLLNKNKKDFSSASDSLEHAFFKTLSVETKELPIAFHRHKIQLGKSEGGLICADPVHLEVGMKDVTLTKKITDLTDDEAQELILILNKHFAEDGLHFIFGSNQSWYISFEHDETIESHSLDSMLMKNIVGKMAQSKQRNWRVVQNEIEMLLHSSDINQQREMAGLETLNSLWLWGAGKPIDVKFEFDKIYSNNNPQSKLNGQIFADAANAQWQTIPDDFTQLLESSDDKKEVHTVILDQLFIPALAEDLDEFQNQLSNIDNSIIKPLLQAWKNKEVDIIINSCDGNILEPVHPSFFDFWRKPKKLRELVDEISS